MDNSPETKKVQTSAAPAKTASASKPAVTPSATPAKAAPTNDYKTANIGQWKSKQEDYFAKQNQERKEKKAKQKATFKKALPFLITFGVLLVVGLGTWGIISLVNYLNRPIVSDEPDNSANAELADVDELNATATEAFKPTYTVNENGDIVVEGDGAAAEEAFAAALASPANKNRVDTIYLAQIVFYSSLSDNQRVIEIAEKVNPDKLNLSEKIKFYNLTYLAYAALGNTDQSNYYYNLMREAANKVTTGIGG